MTQGLWSSGMDLYVGSNGVHPLWLHPPCVSPKLVIGLNQGSWNRIRSKLRVCFEVTCRAVWQILLDCAVLRLYTLIWVFWVSIFIGYDERFA